MADDFKCPNLRCSQQHIVSEFHFRKEQIIVTGAKNEYMFVGFILCQHCKTVISATPWALLEMARAWAETESRGSTMAGPLPG
jgi:hypothetical protein